MISVVVPVYNEHDNIVSCLHGLWGALSAVPHEILVCYDFDEDATLAAIAAMSDAPPTLRLVKNTIGRGAANALRAGFSAARGDVVVTTMADLSDPPEDILRMAELMRRERLAVVAGSRYMRGGSQSGGPLLKRTLSRLGGVSLRWLAGLGTSDATSNFRAYSKSYLDQVDIESRAGFEIALELTVKAHLRGLGVGEVPTTWTDRTAGESRFKLWRWLPNYVRWWWRAAWQPLLVGLAWLVMAAGAWTYVARYAPGMPVWDDLELIPFVGDDYHWTLDEIWTQHNEHRLPLPRPLEVSLIEAFGDVRAPMYAQVVLLAGLALAALLVVRRMRGRTQLVDVLFPLLWLHTGNSENLLMAFQLSLALPTVLVCAILLVALSRRRRGIRAGEAAAIGACTFLLPACGGPGLAQVPILFAGATLAAAASWRTRERAQRRGAVVLVLFLIATAVLSAAYMVGFESPSHAEHTRDPVRVVASGVRTLTLVLGQAGREWWPWSGAWIVGLLAATLLLVARAWKQAPAERMRIAAVVIGIGASASLALSIGFGRAGVDLESGFAVRYIPLVSPLVLAIACGWILFGGRIGRILVPGILALTLLAAEILVNVPRGADYGANRALLGDEVDLDLRAGMEPRPFVDKWVDRVYPDRRRLHDILQRLAVLRMAPFDDAGERARRRFACGVSNLEPTWIDAAEAPSTGWIDGWWPVLLVPSACALHYEVPEGTTLLSGRFGVLDSGGVPPGVRVKVSGVPVDRTKRETLLERTLDPVNVPADRVPQEFRVRIPPGTRRIVLETIVHGAADGDERRAYWSDLFFE